jgi:DNA-binding beta-propeller fold protein YncE
MKLTADRSTAYVSVPTNNEVLEIATDTLEVKRHLSVGSRPMGISLSPDESTLYVALNGAGSVAIVTLATGDIQTVAMTTQLGDARTYDVLALRDGTVLVTSDPESNGFAYVVRFDPATTATPWRVAGGNIIRARPTLLQSPTANNVFVGEGFSPNQLDKLDTSNPNAPIVATPSWGSVGGTGAMAFYPDGSKIILSSGQLIDPNTMTQTGTIGAGFPLINPSATLCYVAAGNSYYWGGTASPGTNTVEIWDLQSQLKVSSFTVANPVDKIAFLVDDARILGLGGQNLFEVKVP